MNFKIKGEKADELVGLTEKEMQQANGGMDLFEWFDKSYKELKAAAIDAYNQYYHQ